MDDVTRNHTHYIVERRGVPQAIVLSFDDFAYLLSDATERRKMDAVIKELRPEYNLGQVLNP
jgi:PHD/YefM family antitoxin component YafN of YafNO toxin-antitoxin module